MHTVDSSKHGGFDQIPLFLSISAMETKKSGKDKNTEAKGEILIIRYY